MLYDEKSCEEAAVLETAYRMCAAARTAPKTRGVDRISTLALTGEEKDALADEMQRLSEKFSAPGLGRDAANVRASSAVVLIGVSEAACGLDRACGLCHFEGCAERTEAGALCAFNPIDLGIAVGSAASVAADCRVDSRVMFSAGRAALELGLLGEGVTLALGLPVSVSGKSPFFDRK